MNKKNLLTLLVILCMLVIGTLIWAGCGGEKPSAKPDSTSPSGESTDPADPTDPTAPTGPVDPVTPTDPVTPIDPTNPTDPENPTDPVDPVDPADPDNPVEPGGDDEPEYYVDENGNLVIIVPGDQGSGGL